MANYSSAKLTSLTEEEYAVWLNRQGVNVLCHKGRYWFRKPFGFYHAIHPLARMDAEEATPPASLCWGFRTTLSETDAHLANSTMPVHLLRDVEGYGLERLSSRRRNQIRNCFKRVEIGVIDKPDLLLAQGYGIAVSAQTRTGYGTRRSPRQYLREVEGFFAWQGGLVLGGIVDGRLGGYLVSYAIGSTAYVDSVVLATEFLDTNISSGLFLAFMQICKNSEVIKQVVHGLHTPENESLCRYKESMGLSVVHVPALSWFLPPTDWLIRRLRPYAYYRLKGIMAESVYNK